MSDFILVERNDQNTGAVSYQVFADGNPIRYTTGDRVFQILPGPALDELEVEAVPKKAARKEDEHVLKDSLGNPVGKVRKVTEG